MTRGAYLVVLFVAAGLILLGLLVVSTANAAPVQSAFLNGVASSVAGHPVNVWAENNPTDWRRIETQAGIPTTSEDYGFTWGPDNWPGHPTVYLAPAITNDLVTLMADNGDTRKLTFLNPYYAARGVEVLIHESVHQRGGAFDSPLPGDPYPNSFEGRTECMAVSLLPTYLPGFGIPATTTTTITTQHRKAIRRHHRIVRWKRWVTSVSTVAANPYFTATLSSAQAQHDYLAKMLPQYAGGCETP
jgi:hypothetical protein